MKNTNKTLAALAGLAAIANIEAQLVKPTDLSHDYRVSVGYAGNADDVHTEQTTIGLAPRDSYFKGPIPVVGQFYDTFRLYDINQISPSGHTHTTLLGAKSDLIKTGNMGHKAIAFAALDSSLGLGAETKHSIKDITLTLNGEHNADFNASRLGGALTYQINPRLQTTLAYDRINQKGKDFEQFFANVITDISEKDTIGLNFASRISQDNSKSHSLGAFWTHYAQKAPWGTFLHTHADWNEQKDTRSFNGELFLTQNPSTSKYGALWTVDRSAEQDGMYNTSVVPLSVTLTEPIRLFDRSFNGWSLSARGNHTSIAGENYSSIGGGLGYIFTPSFAKCRLGVSTEIKLDKSPSQSNITLEPNLLYRGFMPKGLWGASLGLNIPVSGQRRDTIVRGGLVFAF